MKKISMRNTRCSGLARLLGWLLWLSPLLCSAASAQDTQPPTVPNNFTATASSSTGVNVMWSVATDNVAVTGYQLERCQGSGCNSSFAQFNVTSTTYTDPGRTPSTTYGYRVRARDAASNYSTFTSIIYVATPTAAGGPPQGASVTYGHDARGRLTQATFADGTVVNYSYDANGNRTGATMVPGTDTTAPTVPTGLSASAASQTQVNLSWNASTDGVGVTGYRVERCAGASCSNFSQVATPTSTSHADTGLSPNTTYIYRVRAADGAGNLSGYSSTVSVTTSGSTAPSAPGIPSFSALAMNSATASWSAATDDVGVTGYQYRVNGGPWQSLGNVLSVNLTGLSPGVSYTFGVRAKDSGNNWGLVATGSFTTPTDTSAPTVPTGLSASAPNSSTVNLSWTASTDNIGVSGYRIYRGGTQIGTSGTTSYTDSTVSGSTSYSYTVSAYDAVGNASARSSAATVTTPDTIAPSTPTGLSASAASATQVNLSWSASSDTGGSGLAGYRIYRNGTHITSVSSASYSDTAVSPSTLYSYTVVAYDNANNASGHSNTASVTTPSNIPATPGLSVRAGTNSSNFIVNWTVPSGPLSYYELETSVNWGAPGYTTHYPPQTSLGNSGGDTDWDIRIRACNASGQCSAWSSTVSWHTCPVSGCP